MKALIRCGDTFDDAVAAAQPLGRGGAVCVAAADGEVLVSSHEPGRHVTARVDAEVEKPGRVAVDHQALAAVVFASSHRTVIRLGQPEPLALPEAPLHVGVGLDLGSMYARLRTDVPTPSANSPAPDAEWVERGALPDDVFVDAVRTAALAADRHGMFAALSGVHLRTADGVLTVQASDRVRSATASVPLTYAPGGPDLDVTLPADALPSRAGTLGSAGGDVHLATTTVHGITWLRLQAPRWSALLGTLDANYPTLPPAPDAVAAYETDLVPLVDLAAPVRACRAKTVNVAAGREALTLFALGPAGGVEQSFGPSTMTRASADVDADLFFATLSELYDLGWSSVRVAVTGPASPITLTSAAEPGHVIVLATVRTMG